MQGNVTILPIWETVRGQALEKKKEKKKTNQNGRKRVKDINNVKQSVDNRVLAIFRFNRLTCI